MGKKRQMHLVESKFSVEEVCDVLTRFGGLVYPAASRSPPGRSTITRRCGNTSAPPGRVPIRKSPAV